MSTPMIPENWPNLLEPGLRALWYQQNESIVATSPVPLLYNVTDSSRATETTLGIGGFGDPEEYKGTIEYDSPSEDFTKVFTPVQYAKGVSITRNMYKFDQYNAMNAIIARFGLSFFRKREKDAASMFNNAFSTTYNTTPDGKALCATDHYRGKVNSTAQSNKGTSALTYDAVIATSTAMRAFVDDRDQLINVMPDTLVVPAALESTAWTLVNSMNKPGTANNDANFLASGGYRVIVWRYLTDNNNWFMADSTMAKQHLWWFDVDMPEFALDPTGDFNLKANYRGYMQYSYGADDYRWIYGHEVA